MVRSAGEPAGIGRGEQPAGAHLVGRSAAARRRPRRRPRSRSGAWPCPPCAFARRSRGWARRSRRRGARRGGRRTPSPPAGRRAPSAPPGAWAGSPLVDGRANQRVPELDARLSETNRPWPPRRRRRRGPRSSFCAPRSTTAGSPVSSAAAIKRRAWLSGGRPRARSRNAASSVAPTGSGSASGAARRAGPRSRAPAARAGRAGCRRCSSASAVSARPRPDPGALRERASAASGSRRGEPQLGLSGCLEAALLANRGPRI